MSAISVIRRCVGRLHQKQHSVDGVQKVDHPLDVRSEICGDDHLSSDAYAVALGEMHRRAERDPTKAVEVAEGGRALEIDKWRVWPIMNSDGSWGFIGHSLAPLQTGLSACNLMVQSGASAGLNVAPGLQREAQGR